MAVAQKEGVDRLAIREIARRAGVSPSTVSRVLNGRLGPRCPSYSRVMAAGGRQARQRQDDTQGYILAIGKKAKSGLSDDTLRLEACLERGARDLGFGFALTRTAVGGNLRDLRRRLNVAGLICLSPDFQADASLPQVRVRLGEPAGEPGDSVDTDRLGGVVGLLTHLKRMGHRRVAYFHDHAVRPDETLAPGCCLPRCYALAGLEYDPELIWAEDFAYGEHEPVLERALGHFLSPRLDVSAIVLASDCYAPSFYRQLGDCRRVAGINISVVGNADYTDDSLRMSLCPRLTSVRTPVEVVAAEAVRMLNQRIRCPDLPSRRMLIRPVLLEGLSVVDRSHVVRGEATRTREG